LLIIFKIPTKLFSDLYPAKFLISQQNYTFRKQRVVLDLAQSLKFITTIHNRIILLKANQKMRLSIESSIQISSQIQSNTKPYICDDSAYSIFLFSSILAKPNGTWQCQAILRERHRNPTSFFFFSLLNNPGKRIQAAGRYLNTQAITRMESTTIMRDSQTFEQCPHLGPGLAQTVIKRVSNDITVTEYRPLSISTAIILSVFSIICCDIRTVFILNNFQTCIVE